jgi:hypothetical protein
MLPAGRLRHEKGWLQEFVSSLDTDGINTERLLTCLVGS